MKRIRKITIEEAKERMKGSYKSSTPSIDEVYRKYSSRGELVRMPNGDYRIYTKLK